MNPKHEKYLTGDMDEAERAAMERELEQNPALREQLESERMLLESLQNQLLRRRIEAALSTPDELEGSKPGVKQLVWFGLAVFIVVVSWFLWRQLSTHRTVEPKEVAPPEKSGAPVAVFPGTPQDLKQDSVKAPPKTGEPIAQATIKPHSLRGLRGNGHGRTSWEALVLQIWDAPFPVSPASFSERFRPVAEYLQENNTTDAFLLLRKLELQLPNNDTLAFLNGYCLMQMWEGEGALQSFNKISGQPKPWSEATEWYEGLCYLLMGKKEKAVADFKRLAGRPGHPYRGKARRALQEMGVQ